MNIQMITKILTDAGIEENEAKVEIKLLLEHFCDYTEKDAVMGVKITDEQMKLLEEKAKLRAENRIPIQYLTGKAYFMGEFFKVTPDVLIPRDETEILVRKGIELIKKYKLKDILDIGTGSGCIACTIAKNTDAVVLGVDISSGALRVALDNVTKLGINNRAVFRKSNLFEKIREDEKFDMIISNPPYIPFGTELSPEVNHEPSVALFADENGLCFYRNIIKQAPKFLNENGWLIFEMGINESKAIRTLMEEHFTNIHIEKDLAGIDRIIYGHMI